MYVFQATATAKRAMEGLKAGQKAPFIVYINFPDLFGAEQLCKLYLLKSGFMEPVIEKRKLLAGKYLEDPIAIAADKAMSDAMKTGYHIQLFESH